MKREYRDYLLQEGKMHKILIGDEVFTMVITSVPTRTPRSVCCEVVLHEGEGKYEGSED